MMDDFHHSGEVALLLKFTRIDVYQIEQFFGVDQVEVAGQCQVAGRTNVFFDKRMAKCHIIFTLRTIPQVAQQQLAQKRQVTLSQTGMFQHVGLVLFQLGYFGTYFGKNVGNGLVGNAAHPVHKGVARFGIEFYRCKTGAILPTVVLFFHQQVQLVDAVHDGSVFL